MKYLTEQQFEKYQNDGFLLLKNFFSKDELETIIKSIEKFSEINGRFISGETTRHLNTSKLAITG